jgi:hypothetical protein
LLETIIMIEYIAGASREWVGVISLIITEADVCRNVKAGNEIASWFKEKIVIIRVAI